MGGGRVFEQALGGIFAGKIPGTPMFREWSAAESSRNCAYSHNGRHSGTVHVRAGSCSLPAFVRTVAFAIRQLRRNLQIKVVKPLSGTNDFVAYVDAVGQLDGSRCILLEWKTTSSRYPEEPIGLLALDPQLALRYSWMTGIAEVAQIVFVRKRLVEVQYLRTTLSPSSSGDEFGQLVEDTVSRIQSAQFLPHSGVHALQNPCSSCPYVGFCLGRDDLAASALVRRTGAEDLGWLNELAYSGIEQCCQTRSQTRQVFVLTKIERDSGVERQKEAERAGYPICRTRALFVRGACRDSTGGWRS